MALQPCWCCLSRLSLQSSSRILPQSTRSIPHVAPFSTTALRPAAAAPPKRGERKFNLKKTPKRVKTHKIPAVGERKALRKRVVLSNTNALEVTSLHDWSEKTCEDATATGQMTGLPGQVVDGLRALESFKASQGWGFFRRPACLIRKETQELVSAMDAGKERPLRQLIIGPKGCGKSVLLLQAHAAALMKRWVVIHFPEAYELVSATTAYAPQPNSKPTQYIQKDYTAALLSRIARANAAALSKLTVTQDHSYIPGITQKDMTLLQLAEFGASDPEVAWAVFEGLWQELTLDNSASSTSAAPAADRDVKKGTKQTRPPILLTLDGVAHISRPSNYLTPSMHYIHAHDLAIVSFFQSYLSGTRSLPNGGAVLAADSASNKPITPALDLAVRQSEEREAAAAKGEQIDQPTHDPRQPYSQFDERSVVALRKVPVLRLAGFSKDETRAALEYYAKSGMLRAQVSESFVSQAWTVSGGGLVGELERSSVAAGVV